MQDFAFAIDQLVEIAIRALSPAVNDTFTALTCIDWLTDGLCKVAAGWDPKLVHRDRHGNVRVLAAAVTYNRFVERAFDKIRQSSKGMPAVMIRQLDALTRVMAYTTTADQRSALLEQGDMIWRSCETSVPEPSDRADVRRRYDTLVAIALAASGAARAHASEPTRSAARPIEREVQLEHVDSGLAEEPEGALVGVRVDEVEHLIDVEAACGGHSGRLELGVRDRDVRVEPAPRRGHRIDGHRDGCGQTVLVAVRTHQVVDSSGL